MTAKPWSIKQGDTLPILQAVLTDEDPDTGLARVIDLTGATVALHLCPDGATSPVLTRAATILGATAGRVQVQFTAAETAALDIPLGAEKADYWREWQITFGDGNILTVPNSPGPRGIRTVIERQIA